MIQGGSGRFYGSTRHSANSANGGTGNAYGCIFELAPDGSITAQSDLPLASGAQPMAGLLLASDGVLYGTATAGGANNLGSVFRVTPGRSLIPIYSFTDGTNGSSPAAALIQATDGNFYGTTEGQNYGISGSVFRLTPAGAITSLHTFSRNVNPADGYMIEAALLQASDGNFYGVAAGGGTGSVGTLFKITPAGDFTVLHHFMNGAEGASPRGTLIQGRDGNLYGTTASTVFRLDLSLRPVVQFHTRVNSVNEADGTASLRVDRIGGTGYTSAKYQTADRGAVAGTDYTAATGFVAWEANDQTPKYITVPIINRNLADGSARSLSVEFYNAGGPNILGYPRAAVLTINSPRPVPVITSATSSGGTVNTAFSYQITATGNPTRFSAAGLPPGLGLNPATGLISGTLPDDKLSYTVTLSATNDSGTGTASLRLDVYPPSPVVRSAEVTVEFAKQIYYQIDATNGPKGYSASGLPDYLHLNPDSGIITGSVGVGPGTYTVDISAFNDNPVAGTGTLTIHVILPPPQITNDPAPQTIRQGDAFSYQITASNSPTSFEASDLPPGLAVDTATGLITGVVKDYYGSSTVSLRASNGTGAGPVAYLSLDIRQTAPVVTSPAAASGKQGTAFSYRITADYVSYGPAHFGASHLPAGLAIDQATGIISGTPTMAGTFDATIAAFNDAGHGSKKLTLTLAGTPPVVTSTLTAAAAQGKAFAYQIAGSNTPTKYGAAYLPAGLRIDQATGKISGAPTAAGTFTVTIAVFNATGSGQAKLTLTVKASAPVVTSATAASAKVGKAFTYQITAANNPASYGAASLPGGLTINQTTGVISGTPKTAGTYTATIAAFNSVGSGQAKLTLTVAP